MIILAFWLPWGLISLILGVVVWRKVHGGADVYALITISGVHLAGVFVFYGLVNHIPLW